MTDLDCGIVVIGGGIGGASVAAHLAETASVTLLEMEDQPGYHTTGRSAAQFCETYGNSTIRSLSRASRAFFFSPPVNFCTVPLVKPRANLTFARYPQQASLEAYADSLGPSEGIERLSAERTLAVCPIIRPDDLAGAILDSRSADIDVHALHQGYLKLLKARGGIVRTAAQVVALERTSDSWRVATRNGSLRARLVVNAAGAWAGEIGKLAGAQDIGLEPRRRTAALIEPPPGPSVRSWPMVADVDETFYIKPDAGLLLLSPADETPSSPCDAQPEELDLAVAVDRLERATTLEVRRIVRKWAGLRCFVRDRSPCVGFDSRQPGFFWLAALGGYGIQTAPALSKLAAAMVLGQDIEAHLSPLDFEASALDPSRL